MDDYKFRPMNADYDAMMGEPPGYYSAMNDAVETGLHNASVDELLREIELRQQNDEEFKLAHTDVMRLIEIMSVDTQRIDATLNAQLEALENELI